MTRTLITGGLVIPVTSRATIYNPGAVLIEGDKIAWVGPAAEAPKADAQTKIIDATGKLVMPGLINTHCHAAMTLLRGYADDMRLQQWLQEKIWPVEAKMTGDDIYWGTMLAAWEMLSGGITTFLNMYVFPDDEARAIQDSGIRGIIARGIIAIGGPGAAAARLSETKEAFQKWNGKADGRISFMVGPHAPYTCPPDTLLACLELADELDIPIHTHLSETAFEVEEALKTWGKTPIQHIHDLGLTRRKVVAAHCVHITDEEIEIAKATGMGVCHNPVSNLKLASGIAPVQKMRRAGIAVGIGTDGAASENMLHILGSELRIAGLLAKNLDGDPAAFTAWDGIQMATIEGARALGMDDKIGSLEVGKQADLILIDLDRPHLTPNHDPYALVAYSALPGDVVLTMVAGKVVYEQGRILTMDPQEVLAKSREAAARLVAE
jgi:5-methylthioadenosine/S-adenosylhomocysteine deaminase